MSRKNHAVQRIQKEMLELIKQPLAYVSAGPDDESDLTRWSATIAGPKGTPYEGGVPVEDFVPARVPVQASPLPLSYEGLPLQRGLVGGDLPRHPERPVVPCPDNLESPDLHRFVTGRSRAWRPAGA